MLCLVRKRRGSVSGEWWPRWRYPKRSTPSTSPMTIWSLRSWRDRYCPGCGWPSLSGAETVGRMASCSPWNGRRRTHHTEAGAVLSGPDAPVLMKKGIQLALWMRERYFCTVSDAVKAMLPAGMYFALRDSVTLVPGLGRNRSGICSRTLQLPPGWRRCSAAGGAGT